MEAIKEIVFNVIKDLEQKKGRFPDDEPQAWLKKVLTKKELGHIKVDYFKRGILGVSVDGSSWLYSLSLKKETILQKLKKNFPRVKEMRLYIGEV